MVASIQGKDLLSLDLSDIKKSIGSDHWIKDVEIKKSLKEIKNNKKDSKKIKKETKKSKVKKKLRTLWVRRKKK